MVHGRPEIYHLTSLPGQGRLQECLPGQGALVPEAATPAAATVASDAAAGAQPVVPWIQQLRLAFNIFDLTKKLLHNCCLRSGGCFQQQTLKNTARTPPCMSSHLILTCCLIILLPPWPFVGRWERTENCQHST